MGAVVDFASWVWSIVQNLIGTLKTFIDIIWSIPEFIINMLSFLPSEIKTMLFMVVSILIIVSIFKFVK